MSKRTIALIAFLVVITAVLTSIAVSPKKSPPPPPTSIARPTPTESKAKTLLSLYPDPLTISSLSGSLDVRISALENNVTAVQLELSYDPQVILNPVITVGSFFANPVVLLKNIDQKNGRISYALGIAPTGTAVKGVGSVATITFQARMTPGSQTKINVLPTTMVTAEGILPTVLKTATGATIIYSPVQ